MSRRERSSESVATLSVLDRLIDDEPKRTADEASTFSESVRRLKAGLRRDLEWLLNTRRIAVPLENQPELAQSVYAYGVPDCTALSVSSPKDQARLLRFVQTTLETFEPRLDGVRIIPIEDDGTTAKTLRFRIEAVLLMDPAPEHVSFDTVLELTRGEYEIRAPPMRDELLLYYEQELTYLRQTAAQFAEKYPKIASRLALEPDKCEDPHVERLLEGFALLAARVHMKLDSEFPEITQSLLDVVYPHFLRPVPSMSIAEFYIDPAQGKLTTGLKIPRGSVIQSRPVSGVPCKFRTAYETTLWPLTVAAAEWTTPDRLAPAVRSPESVGAVRIELACNRDVRFADLRPQRLRFHVNAEGRMAHKLYELLSSRLNRIIVRERGGGARAASITLEPSALQPVGFAEDEAILPYPRRSFQGYRLLQEYFAFPEKFFFFDLIGLDEVWNSLPGDRAELIFLISSFEGADSRDMLELGVSARTFRLACTPIVNLFSQAAEPVLLSHQKFEYPVVPDVRRPYDTEIFSIDRVSGLNLQTREETEYQPFYAFRHSADGTQPTAFWTASRRDSLRPNDTGTDTYISLLNLSMQPVIPNADTLTVHATCTNRDLPSRLPLDSEGGDFQLEGVTAIKKIVALRKPTATLRPPLGKDLQWRLISHLSLNYLSLVEEGRDALQQILKLYNYGESPSVRKMIEGLTRLESRSAFCPVATNDTIAFARGTRIEIEFDEEQFVGGGVYLFAAIIERFLSSYASLNSFTQLAVRTKQRKELLREWAPRAGQQILV